MPVLLMCKLKFRVLSDSPKLIQFRHGIIKIAEAYIKVRNTKVKLRGKGSRGVN